ILQASLNDHLHMFKLSLTNPDINTSSSHLMLVALQVNELRPMCWEKYQLPTGYVPPRRQKTFKKFWNFGLFFDSLCVGIIVLCLQSIDYALVKD
ncbi:hypothetical protein TorRG33x02_108750, partial [Trema orientale]